MDEYSSEEECKMKIFILSTIFCLFSAFLLCDQFAIKHQNDIYNIITEYPLSIYWKDYDTEPQKEYIIKNDFNKIFIKTNTNDSLYVFIIKNSFFAYCVKKNNFFYLSKLQPLVYDTFLNDFEYLDLDNDGNLEFITVYGDDSNFEIAVDRFDVTKQKYVEVLKYSNLIIPQLKIKNNVVYILYSLDEGIPTRYGKLDYSKDETQEIYFMPISNILLKDWEDF